MHLPTTSTRTNVSPNKRPVLKINDPKEKIYAFVSLYQDEEELLENDGKFLSNSLLLVKDPFASKSLPPFQDTQVTLEDPSHCVR
jgi:hypothetical protein